MACNSYGKTFINSLTPYPGATEDSASYLANLTHYTCGGRRICSLESFPVTADLNYRVQSVDEVGDGLYNLNILATGTCTFMPYSPNCPGGGCPVTEPIYAYLSVPCTADDAITVTAGDCVCSLNGISCNCNTSSSVNIAAAFTVEVSASE